MSRTRWFGFGGASSLLVGALLSLFATPAEAQFGPVLSSAGPVNRSMGGTSTAAPLSASGALLWNPATLAGLKQSELDAGAELLFPHTSLYSSILAGSVAPGVPLTDQAGASSNASSVYALPTIALSYRPENSPFTYGLGAFAVAGFGLDYAGSTTNPVLSPPPPVGLGFGPLYAQYQVLQIAPALVYAVNDQLSLSVSPLLDIGLLQLDPLVVAAPNDANGNGFATYPYGTHSRQSWGAGFNLGAYYQTPVWGFGAAYKSQQWFQTYKFNTTNEVGVPSNANFTLNLPAIVSVGTSYRGIDGLLLAADLRYLDFANASGFGDSGFAPTGALQGIGYKSIIAASLGAQLQMSEKVSLRTGYSWSENPISSGQASANAASPLIIQNMLSAGATYNVNQALSLNVAYSHAFENSVAGPIILPTGTIPGSYIKNSASIDMVSAGATVRF